MADCGTYAGYQMHHKRGEPIDEACAQANRAYQQDYRHRKPEYYRAFSRDRSTAYRELARRHREEFDQIMAEIRQAKR